MKLLQNLKPFQKLPIFLESKYVAAKIHFDFYFRHLIRAGIREISLPYPE